MWIKRKRGNEKRSFFFNIAVQLRIHGYDTAEEKCVLLTGTALHHCAAMTANSGVETMETDYKYRARLGKHGQGWPAYQPMSEMACIFRNIWSRDEDA